MLKRNQMGICISGIKLRIYRRVNYLEYFNTKTSACTILSFLAYVMGYFKISFQEVLALNC